MPPTNMDKQRQDLVLVADDSPDALSLINDTLEQAGIDVLVALEGQQALNIAKRMPPDIILLDAMMPKMDGFETCRELKRDPALADIPVIFMTGLTDTQDLVRAFDAGGVDYLTKPVKPDELLARMRVHLQNARLTASARTAHDSIGQPLLTVDAEGDLLWATPQANRWLQTLGAAFSWRESGLTAPIAQWLAREPLPRQKLSLRTADKAFTVVMVEARQMRSEYLLRLVQESEVREDERLREQLGLTVREAEVLMWISRGKTNREIATILSISPRTVNKHLEQVFQKIGVENRTAAASKALAIIGSM